METVYIETTIPSYLTAHRSHQEPMASHQQITQDWWDHERMRFRLYSSIAVRAEISKPRRNRCRRDCAQRVFARGTGGVWFGRRCGKMAAFRSCATGSRRPKVCFGFRPSVVAGGTRTEPAKGGNLEPRSLAAHPVCRPAWHFFARLVHRRFAGTGAGC